MRFAKSYGKDLDFKRCSKAFVLCDVSKTKLCNVEVLTCAKFEFYSYKRIFPNILDDEWKNLIRNVDIKESGTYFLNKMKNMFLPS